MVQCIVPFCKKRSDNNDWKKRKPGEKVIRPSFFRIPKHAEKRKLWSDFLGMDLSSVALSSRICSLHFHEEDLDKSRPACRLMPGAVPKPLETPQDVENKPLPFSCNEFEYEEAGPSVSPAHSTLSDYKDEKILLDYKDEKILLDYKDEKFPLDFKDEKFPLDFKDEKLFLPMETKQDKAVQTSPEQLSKLDKATMVSAELIYYSPEKVRLRKRIAYIESENRKKMKAALQTIRRQKDQLIYFKSLIDTMKKK